MKKKHKKIDDYLNQSPIMRRRKIETRLWAQIDEIEKQKPASLVEALEQTRQSKRLRARLVKFTKFSKLKLLMSPSHALLVDLWGKEKLLLTGSLKQMQRIVDEFESVRNAGYKVINLAKMLDGEEAAEEGGS